MDFLKRILRGLIFSILAAVLLFEEWGWEPLANLFNRLAHLPLWAHLERKIAGLPKWGALLVFGVPMLALLPIKLLAVLLFGRGHAVAGLVLLIVAKLLGCDDRDDDHDFHEREARVFGVQFTKHGIMISSFVLCFIPAADSGGDSMNP